MISFIFRIEPNSVIKPPLSILFINFTLTIKKLNSIGITDSKLSIFKRNHISGFSKWLTRLNNFQWRPIDFVELDLVFSLFTDNNGLGFIKNNYPNWSIDVLYFKQGNLLKGIDKKTVRREGIEYIKRVFTYVLFSVTHFL